MQAAVPLPQVLSSITGVPLGSIHATPASEASTQNERRLFNFYFYYHGSWNAFEDTANRELSSALLAGAPTGYFSLGEEAYSVDFKAYLQQNVNSGYKRSIGWTDTTTNQNYGPSSPFEGDCKLASEAEKVARAARIEYHCSPVDPFGSEAQHISQMPYTQQGAV